MLTPHDLLALQIRLEPSYYRLLAKGARPSVGTGEAAVKQLAALCDENRAKIDSACLQFVEAGRWPRLSPTEKYLAAERLTEALAMIRRLAYCAGQHRPLIRICVSDEKDLLRFLLVPFWQSLGRHAFYFAQTLR